MNWCKSTAKIYYNPPRPGLRKIRQNALLVANVDNGIAEYYRWWVFRRFGLRLNHPAWIPHITLFDGRMKADLNFILNLKKYHNTNITFEYSVNIEQHWKFWVLPVRGEQLDIICNDLKISKKNNFHITIGRMD
jgi:hypothetical protein